MPRLCLSLLLSVLVASSASAVTMDWTFVGNPGNACDPRPEGIVPGCFGAVGYAYHMGTYEVTNAQYAEFLNAKGASNGYTLYNESMNSAYGGIVQSGSPGSYSYSTIPGRELRPVNYVSFFDALRFVNWMSNGQGNGDTETGTYSLLGEGTPLSVTRNVGATIFLPSEDEWYKAAYYDRSSASYFTYPAGSNMQTICTGPTTTPNSANCNNANGQLTSVGSYPGSASPYGTFDQGGNLWEWNEAIINANTSRNRGVRGGSYNQFDPPEDLASSARGWSFPIGDSDFIGFRLAMIPEPGTGLLVFAGLLGLAGWRRNRH